MANQLLENTLIDLKAAQVQLVHQEKLSVVGQMIAGLAHEINNPVSFIMGNLEHTQAYMETLFNTTTLLQQYCPDNHPEIQSALAEAELDFIRADFPNVLTSMQHGAERIQSLILNLRNFARLDESNLKSVDIHNGLDNA